MEKIKQHFCWVKAVAAPRTPQALTPIPAPGPNGAPAGADANRQGEVSQRIQDLFRGTMELAWTQSLARVTGDLVPVEQGNVPPPPDEQGNVPPPSDEQGKVPPPPVDEQGRDLPPPPPDEQGKVPPPAPVTAESAGRGGAQPDQGNVPPPSPLMFAGASFMGAWQVEAHSPTAANAADAGIALVWQPVLGSRDEAMAWKASPEGRLWCRNALALTLLSFSAIGQF
jgi:hypothetical protein